jgi:hypothetical protein
MYVISCTMAHETLGVFEQVSDCWCVQQHCVAYTFVLCFSILSAG